MKRDDFFQLVNHVGDYEKAKIIVDYKERLTPDGFELYVTEFFRQKEYGFTTFKTGGFNDKGIDVKGKRIESDGTETFLIVQCKKWFSEWIHQKDVTDFYGQVVDHKNGRKIFLVFATTTEFTKKAKEFCEQKEILVIDIHKIAELNEGIGIHDWIEQKRKEMTKDEFDKYIIPHYFEKMRILGEQREKDKYFIRMNTIKNASYLKNGIINFFSSLWKKLTGKTQLQQMNQRTTNEYGKRFENRFSQNRFKR